jgi:hypothetical protein
MMCLSSNRQITSIAGPQVFLRGNPSLPLRNQFGEAVKQPLS